MPDFYVRVRIDDSFSKGMCGFQCLFIAISVAITPEGAVLYIVDIVMLIIKMSWEYGMNKTCYGEHNIKRTCPCSSSVKKI